MVIMATAAAAAASEVIFLNSSSSSSSNLTGPYLPLSPPPQSCYAPPGVEQVTSPFARDFILLLYIFTAILSLTSNGAVILVQLYGSSSSRSIRKYLNSLAVSDIMLVFMAMPATYSSTVIGEWVYPGWFCRSSRYFQILSSFVTSTTLTIIGIERYVVTLHPLSRSCNWFQTHNRTLLLVSWAVGLAYSCLANTNELSQFSIDNNATWHYQCTVNLEAEQLLVMQIFVTVHFLLSFILPLVAIIASYAAIMNKLKFNNSFIAQYFSSGVGGSGSSASGGEGGGGGGGGGGGQRGRAWICVKAKDETPNAAVVWPSVSVDHRSKSIKMMLIVIVMYCICWTPIKLFQLLNYYSLIPYCSEEQYHRWIASYVAANWLAMANCFVNPFIYSFMSCNFRDDFRRICKSFWGFFAKQRKNAAGNHIDV